MEQQIKEFESLAELLEDLEHNGITGIQKIRCVEDFLMRKSRLRGKPYSASFELTPLCNFDCKMCYMHLTKEQMQASGRMLTTDEWLKIAQQAVEAGVASVDITGGECLTHPGFKELYLYLINQGMHVSVLTNGQLITQEYVQLFSQYKPSVVQISFYGSSEDAYFKVTGKRAFHDVLNAITSLKEAGVCVRLTVTPNRFMQNDAAAMLSKLHELNIDYTIGSTTLPARIETGRDIADYIVDNEAYIEICKMEDEYRKNLMECLNMSPAPIFQFKIKGQETMKGAPCAAGAAHFHINWKGEMTPCIGYHAVTISVLDTSLQEAWKWIRDTMEQYRFPPECNNCELKESCIGCSAEKTSGVLNGPLNQWVCKRMFATRRLPETSHTNECTC